MKKNGSSLLILIVGILVVLCCALQAVIFFGFHNSWSSSSSTCSSTTATSSFSSSSSSVVEFCGSSNSQQQRRKFAFVWYLSNPFGYPCSILAAIRKLRDDLQTPSSCIETVLVYNQVDVPAELIGKLKKTNLIDSFVAFDDIPTTTDADTTENEANGSSYYKGVLTKLSIFRLDPTYYDRIIFLDADSYPLRPLHSLLLDLPKASPIDFWAVRPYWLHGTKQTICSALMVLKPNPQFYEQQLKQQYFPHGFLAKPQTYDMDILDEALGDQAGLLPDSLLELDAFFEKPSLLLKHQNNNTTTRHYDHNRRLADASLFHFSNFKPWSSNLRRVFKHPSLAPVKEIILEWRTKVQQYCPNYIDVV